MSRRRLPVKAEGVLIEEHRNGRGRVVTETRAHFDSQGGFDIIRWDYGGGRIPEEWAHFSAEAAEKLETALRLNIDRRAADRVRERMAAAAAVMKGPTS